MTNLLISNTHLEDHQSLNSFMGYLSSEIDNNWIWVILNWSNKHSLFDFNEFKSISDEYYSYDKFHSSFALHVFLDEYRKNWVIINTNWVILKTINDKSNQDDYERFYIDWRFIIYIKRDKLVNATYNFSVIIQDWVSWKEIVNINIDSPNFNRIKWIFISENKYLILKTDHIEDINWIEKDFLFSRTGKEFDFISELWARDNQLLLFTSNGHLLYKENKNYFIINTKTKLKIGPFGDVRDFSEGKCMVESIDWEVFYIDEDGKKLFSIDKNILPKRSFHWGFYWLFKNWYVILWNSIIDTEWKELVKLSKDIYNYDSIADNFLMVKYEILNWFILQSWRSWDSVYKVISNNWTEISSGWTDNTKSIWSSRKAQEIFIWKDTITVFEEFSDKIEDKIIASLFKKDEFFKEISKVWKWFHSIWNKTFKIEDITKVVTDSDLLDKKNVEQISEIDDYISVNWKKFSKKLLKLK